MGLTGADGGALRPFWPRQPSLREGVEQRTRPPPQLTPGFRGRVLRGLQGPGGALGAPPGPCNPHTGVLPLAEGRRGMTPWVAQHSREKAR